MVSIIGSPTLSLVYQCPSFQPVLLLSVHFGTVAIIIVIHMYIEISKENLAPFLYICTWVTDFFLKSYVQFVNN